MDGALRDAWMRGCVDEALRLWGTLADEWVTIIGKGQLRICRALPLHSSFLPWACATRVGHLPVRHLKSQSGCPICATDDWIPKEVQGSTSKVVVGSRDQKKNI
jgi:hypothetical protein